MSSLIECPDGKSGLYVIPPGVKVIENYAFRGCQGLSAISIPSGVTTIEYNAFEDCTGLTELTFPADLGFIDSNGFDDCDALERVVFLGDAPALASSSVSFPNPAVTIYYLSSSIGFSSPVWEGHSAVEIDEGAFPAARWLLSHQLPHDTTLDQDLNGDGVSLLMAFALNLDPHSNPMSGPPTPQLDVNSFSLTFFAASPGITYTVETSIDLETWTTEGVTMSGLDLENLQTASVGRIDQRRFLRLVVFE